jgi:hypothetical protein
MKVEVGIEAAVLVTPEVLLDEDPEEELPKVG